MTLVLLGCLLDSEGGAESRPASTSDGAGRGLPDEGREGVVPAPPQEPPHVGPFATHCPGVYEVPPDTGVLYDCPDPPEGAVELAARTYHASTYYQEGGGVAGAFTTGEFLTGWRNVRTSLGDYVEIALADPSVMGGGIYLWLPEGFPPSLQGEYPDYRSSISGEEVGYILWIYGTWPPEETGSWGNLGTDTNDRWGGSSVLCIERFRKRRLTGTVTFTGPIDAPYPWPEDTDVVFHLRFDFFDDTCWEDIRENSAAWARTTYANTQYGTIYAAGMTEEKYWSRGWWEKRAGGG